MCSLFLSFSPTHCCELHNTRRDEKWKREWLWKISEKFEFKVSHRPHALRSERAHTLLSYFFLGSLFLSLCPVKPKSRLHAWVKTLCALWRAVSLLSWGLCGSPGDAYHGPGQQIFVCICALKNSWAEAYAPVVAEQERRGWKGDRPEKENSW